MRVYIVLAAILAIFGTILMALVPDLYSAADDSFAVELIRMKVSFAFIILGALGIAIGVRSQGHMLGVLVLLVGLALYPFDPGVDSDWSYAARFPLIYMIMAGGFGYAVKDNDPEARSFLLVVLLACLPVFGATLAVRWYDLGVLGQVIQACLVIAAFGAMGAIPASRHLPAKSSDEVKRFHHVA